METNKLISKFENYILIELGYQHTTYVGYKNNIINYLDWLSDNSIKPKKITLDQLYSFIAYRRKKGDSNRYISAFKTAITHFNHSLKMKENPALILGLAKCDRAVPTDIIDEEFLESIYRETTANTLVQKRDRCILGMMVFLGLQRIDLASLELEHLDLDNAKLYVPKTPTTDGRHISLHPRQILHLSQYIYDLRPRLLKYFKKETNQLFFSSGTGTSLSGALNVMLKRIKLECHYVRSFKQLRQSRIVIWVRELGLREAQYLGGYRYVTSVQRYDFKSVDDLQKLLAFHHPMEKMA